MRLPDWLVGPVALVGLGRSHQALAALLLGHQLEVVAFDANAERQQEVAVQALCQQGLKMQLGPDYLQGGLNAYPVVFVTPGVPKHLPALQAAAAAGSRLTGDVALFLELHGDRCLGITGSAGKTTTTTLVGEMLGQARIDAVVAGNIGRPVSELYDDQPPRWYVLELSSFQLQLSRHSPHIAALLNLAPNHLDVHRDFAEYRQAKLNILRYQRTEDLVVLPAEGFDATGCEGFLGRRLVVGQISAQGDGAWQEQGQLWLSYGGHRSPLLAAEELRLPGRHNVDNALFAALLARVAGADLAAIQEVLRRFTGVEHRLEPVRSWRGIRFVNDSIATAPDRTLAALQAVQAPIVLLAGGYDKGLDYTPLQALLGQKVRLCLTSGVAGAKIAQVARQAGVEVLETTGLQESFNQAVRLARAGDTVLLSPSAASYDEFHNFEERGRAFKGWALSLEP